jgi:hypothetical protein
MATVCIRQEELDLVVSVAERTAHRTNGRVVLDRNRLNVLNRHEQQARTVSASDEESGAGFVDRA